MGGADATPEEPAGSTTAPAPSPHAPRESATRRRRRSRLARGPVTIGEPAADIEPLLAVSEPYRPDTVADGGSVFGLTVRAASVRGLFKRYVGGPRQDDMCLAMHEPTRTLIAAVADGVSGAPRSHVGAALAVRHASAAVVRQLDRDGEQALDWNEVFDQAAWALVDEHRRAAGDPSSGVEPAALALATTLAVATIRVQDDGARVQTAAVGDSPAVVLGHGFRTLTGGETRTDGLIGGGVRALPRHPRAWTATELRLATDEVLLVCTDGLALPLGDGTGEVGRVLARELARPPEVIDFARLLDFSRSTYDDDRTLVAVWAGPP
jgi:serine/threonine protein phosphatase PrpC